MMTSIRHPQILMRYGQGYINSFVVSTRNGKVNFSTGNCLRKKSHYDVLGLTPKANMVDIKSAYYDLSKVYHPDRNDGSPESAQKFRDITEAYEILGNYKLRRLYDKGIVHTAGAQYREAEEATEEKDDPQTQFYKRHMKKSEAPTETGRTPIFDFDAWNSHHYGKAFERNQEARRRFNTKVEQEAFTANTNKTEILILGGLAVITAVLYIQAQFDKSPDAVTAAASDKAKEAKVK